MKSIAPILQKTPIRNIVRHPANLYSNLFPNHVRMIFSIPLRKVKIVH